MKNIEISRSRNLQIIELQKTAIKYLIIVFAFVFIMIIVYYRLILNLKYTRFQLAKRTLEKIKQNYSLNSEKFLNSDVENELLIRFKDEVNDKKAFLEPNISLNSIAERLNTNRTYISKIINFNPFYIH